jgi:hypothetical protein
MAVLALLTILTLPVATHQLAVSSLQSREAAELDAELSARRAFAGSVTFLTGLEADVVRISSALHATHTAASLVQLTSELGAPDAAKPSPHSKGIDAATAVKEMNKLKPSQMPAMMSLLTGMYDSWKEKIGEANKKEHQQKTVFDKTIKDLEAKKAMYKDSKDATATYDRIEKYWSRQRAISHRQYHTALKIMHSGMQKFKAVSSAMGNAIAGKKPNAQDLQTVGMAMPDVVLLQEDVHRLAVWTQGATEEIQSVKMLSQ